MGYKDQNKQREYQRLWARKKTTNLTRRKSKLKYKYDISLEDYDLLLKNQKGVCAICSRPPANNTYLVVDHDHQTKQVRGLLCLFCNTGLGMFSDNDDLIERALIYLRSFSG